MRVWAGLLGVERAIVEEVGFEEATGTLVVSVRLRRRDRHRCGICCRRSPGYDAGDGRRRWRALDLGTTKAYVEAEAPRVRCPAHGVVVAAVPWARQVASQDRWKSENGIGSEADVASSHRRTTPWNEG